jgi:protein-tyrosine phosphatase
MRSGAPYSIVLICTGNRFRSPLAEHLLRASVAELQVEVSSVGTMQLPGGPVLPEALELGRGMGLDLSSHCSRALTPELLEDADLVLGFERRHVAAAVVDGGAGRERTFTAGELAALLRAIEPPREADPIERARAAVREADRLRGRLGRDPDGMELADPFGSDTDGFRRSAEAVRELVNQLAAGLFGR